MEDLNIRYQLLRAKSTDYKTGGTPVLIDVETEEKGQKVTKQIQEMEIIDRDYPLCMPILLYNAEQSSQVMAGQPLLVHNDELYAIYNFTQLEMNLDLREVVVNIWVMYVSEAKKSQLTKV
jgi:hypothetical protein